MLEPAVRSCEACALGKNGPCAFRPREVAASTSLAHQGTTSDQVLFVKDGVLGLSTTDAAGHELVAYVRGPTSVLCLEALGGQPSACTVTALTDSTICTISVTELRRLTGLDSERTLTSSVLGLVLREHAAAMRDHDLRAGSARARVARFLGAAAPLMRPGRRAAFSKTHVAALLDLRPETLSRVLRQLEEEGVLRREQLEVTDAAALAEIARGLR